MTKNHDITQHLEFLRQSLSQNNKSIGFFISAGCPLSVEMKEENNWPLIPDVKNLTTWINKEMDSNNKYKILLLELEKAKKDRNNIEDILSFLRALKQVSVGGEVRGLLEEDLENLEKEICKKIVKKINVELPGNQTPYHKLSKWISSIDREIPIEIFTTNYDLLMEDALESLEIPYFDGFVGGKRSFFDLRAVENNLIPIHWTRLWKIHGSINWYQEEIRGNKRIIRSSEIKEEASHLIYPSHLKYDQSRKMPYLALIDKLSRFIKQKSSLLILLGYSFNDEHINDTIINALKSNSSAMVLALMYETYDIHNVSSWRYDKAMINHIEKHPKAFSSVIYNVSAWMYDKAMIDKKFERYPKAYKLAFDRHNLSVWTYDKAIIGTNLGEWNNRENVNDISKYVLTEGNVVKSKLGDFAVFADFLQTLIGNIPEMDKHSFYE